MELDEGRVPIDISKNDSELQAWWPDLGRVVAQLRRLGHPDEADHLLDAVAAGATSGEILGLVGKELLRCRAIRAEFAGEEKASWDRVMKEIDRAYPPCFRFNQWVVRLDRDVTWPLPPGRWRLALSLAGLLCVFVLLILYSR